MIELQTIKLDLLERYRFIEITVLWEGRLTTTMLMECFGISRQQASKDINQYNGGIAPDNLEYDRFLKGYKPAAGFKPVLTLGSSDEYLRLLSQRQPPEAGVMSLASERLHTLILKVPESHRLEPAIVRGIVAAVRHNLRTEVEYVSFTNPHPSKRVLAPHSLIFSGVRWYVRAFCEKRRAYRDFVLSRFRGEVTALGESSQSIAEDREWNTPLKLKIVPDPELSPAQQDIVAYDYGMQDGCLSVETNAALVDYVVKLLRIAPDNPAQRPEARQVAIANLEEIRPWLLPSN